MAIASFREEGELKYPRCVLIVSISGPQRPRPDFLLVGPPDGVEREHHESCIREFRFSRMDTQSDAYIKSQAELLVKGLSKGGLSSFFTVSKAGDAREVVRNQLKNQLEELMQLIEGLPGAPTATEDGHLRALREAATVVVRIMFLGEVETGLLYASNEKVANCLRPRVMP